MRLSDLFTGRTRTENHVDENGRGTQSGYARMAGLNRQIHSLVPGQTIRGEIVSRNGSEVQIRISDDMVMSARVDQSIHLEPGKSVTFEVKSNRGTLSLSPLFTNIAADANVLKALEMAGLQVNDISVSMTEQLMKAGLPVSRSSLLQVYREINSFPEAGGTAQGRVSDVVNLHRLQLPVNEANMQQMESYRNLTHQLIRGMTSVLDALPEAAGAMLAEGNAAEAAGLYRELFSMLQEGMQDSAGASGEGSAAQGARDMQNAQVQGAGATGSAGASGEGSAAQGAQDMQNVQVQGAETTDSAGVSGERSTAQGTQDRQNAQPQGAGTTDGAGASGEGSTVQGAGTAGGIGAPGEAGIAQGAADRFALLSAGERASLAEGMLQAADELQLPMGQRESFQGEMQRLLRGELSGGDFFRTAARLLDAALHVEGGIQKLQKAFSEGAFRKAFALQLKAAWTLSPEDVSRPEKVEELYRRLDRQTKGLLRALEAGGQREGTAYRGTVNLSRSVDFLNQVNHFYDYVQLPLRLHQSEAHGDLYVYTNRKSLADSKGMVSALLHLDMEHLGPLDVYVTLQEAKVNTKFYVADEEILSFIEKHMDLLTARLQKRGYSCSVSASARGDQERRDGGGLAPLLGEQEKGIMLSQYAFDVRT